MMPRTPRVNMAGLDPSGSTPCNIPTPRSGLVRRLAAYLRGRSQPQACLMKRIETLQLAPKRAVYLVECDGDRFLIAAAGDSVSAPVPLTQRFAMRHSATGKEQPR